MLFSVDYPFGPNAAGRALLDTLPLSPGDVAKIAAGNAERVLRLPRTRRAAAQARSDLRHVYLVKSLRWRGIYGILVL